MANGIAKNNDKKLKKENADFISTKLTILFLFTGIVKKGFTVITGNFCRKNRMVKSKENQ